MKIGTRLENLEKLVHSFIESQTRENDYKSIEIENGNNTNTIQNVDISDNRNGIIESFETSIVNSDDIATLREGLEEVYEMLLESEG